MAARVRSFFPPSSSAGSARTARNARNASIARAARAATRQTGFSLIEVTMALVLLGAMSLGALQVQQFQQIVDSGRQAGLRLAALRDGAERYARDHGATLLALKSRLACEKITLSQTSSAGTPPPGDCALKLDGKPDGKTLVVNAFQPSIGELHALDYVNLDDSLPFPHGNTIVDGRTGQAAEPRWAVSVRCHANCDPAKGGGPIFRVMLYNTQPFFAQEDLPFGYGAQLKATLRALGPDAMVSLPGESPETAVTLRGKEAAAVTNPLRGDSPDTGVPGVVASNQLVYVDKGALAPGIACGVATGASGPGASGATCRDGSAMPTQRWDFNAQPLENVGRLQVVGDTAIGGRTTLNKDLQVGLKDHGAWPAHVSVNRGNVDLHEGKLVVHRGYGDFSDQRSHANSRLGGIRLPTTNGPGLPCDPVSKDPDQAGGNLSLHFDGKAMHVMVCRPRQLSALGGAANQRRVWQMDGIWTRSGDARSADRVQLPHP